MNENRVGNGSEDAECGGSESMKQFKSGDVAWVNMGKSSWWPGQVVDEALVSLKSKEKVKDKVLVRLYGTYEYLYVDPVKCSSELENSLKKENISIREVFQRALEVDLSRLRSGGKLKRKVPNSREKSTADGSIHKRQKQAGMKNIKMVQPTRKSKRKEEEEEAAKLKLAQLASDEAKKKEQNCEALGKSKHVDTKQSQNVVSPEIKKLKSKDVKEQKAEKAGETYTPIPIKRRAAEATTTDLSARRLKVMQSLGLIAPSGSPFGRNGLVTASKLQ